MLSKIGTLIYTKIFGLLVGKDSFGNSYYTSKSNRSKKKRWVIYNGVGDASKVPPQWHGWLHFSCDEVSGECSFQKDHAPNTTGTKTCYRKEDSIDTIDSQRLHSCKTWQPK